MLGQYRKADDGSCFEFMRLETHDKLTSPSVVIKHPTRSGFTINADVNGGMHIKSAASTRLMSFTNGEELDDCVLRDHIDNTVNAALGAVNAGEIAGLTTAVESLQATVAAQQDYIDALKAWMAALRGLLAPSPLDFTDLV